MLLFALSTFNQKFKALIVKPQKHSVTITKVCCNQKQGAQYVTTVVGSWQLVKDLAYLGIPHRNIDLSITLQGGRSENINNVIYGFRTN